MREIFDRESGTSRKNKCQVSVTTSLDMSMHLQAIAAEVPCLKYGLRCVVFHEREDSTEQECDRGSGKEDVMSTAAARAAAPAAGAPAKKAAQILVCNPIPIPIRSSNPHP